MEPLTKAALINVGGSLIGGLLGGRKKLSYKDNWNAFRDSQEMQQIAFKNKMDLAKQYKINPLTMLGAQLPQVTAPVYDSRSNMGQNIASSLAKGASSYFTGKAQEELNKLALERAKLENELLRTQILQAQNPVKPGEAYSNDQAILSSTDIRPKPVKTKYGNQFVADRYVFARNPKTGKVIPVTNPEVGDNEFLMGWDFVTVTLPAEVKNKFGSDFDKINSWLTRQVENRANKKRYPRSTSVPSRGYSKIRWSK